jgi:hypothetical protein
MKAKAKKSQRSRTAAKEAPVALPAAELPTETELTLRLDTATMELHGGLEVLGNARRQVPQLEYADAHARKAATVELLQSLLSLEVRMESLQGDLEPAVILDSTAVEV